MRESSAAFAAPVTGLSPRVVAAVALAWTLTLAGCGNTPPTNFFARGSVKESATLTLRINDAYVWRQPAGNNAFVLLTEHRLPHLPEDDPYVITDLGLLLDWSRASYAALAIDEHGSLLGFAAHNGNGGGTSAVCAHNTGACYSAVGYWGTGTDWGNDSMLASYEFGHELDAALAQSIHRQTRYQTPLLSGADQALDPQGNPRLRSEDDFANMFARYARVRNALSANDAPQGFLEANGYSASLADAMLKFDGIDAGIARLASVCPQSDSYEAFGDHGGSGSLLIHHGAEEIPAYFIRRGDDWILKDCGNN